MSESVKRLKALLHQTASPLELPSTFAPAVSLFLTGLCPSVLPQRDLTRQKKVGGFACVSCGVGADQSDSRMHHNREVRIGIAAFRLRVSSCVRRVSCGGVLCESVFLFAKLSVILRAACLLSIC